MPNKFDLSASQILDLPADHAMRIGYEHGYEHHNYLGDGHAPEQPNNPAYMYGYNMGYSDGESDA
jgi:hypothetical protein